MHFHEQNKHRGSLIFGALIILAGALLLLANFGFLSLHPYWQYWPLILVALALSKIAFPQKRKDFAEGVWLLTLGVWLQLSILRLYGLTFANSWPILLVGFGIHMMLKPATHHRENNSVEVHNVS